ncbi:hypothetical protein MNV49_005191 [Pseudohyphozyma bogoriensis]|nr:hypothetical protein MNV49_005191 [Pseudohyphozyma bogoriensis]
MGDNSYYWPFPNYLITTGVSAAITQSFLVYRTYSMHVVCHFLFMPDTDISLLDSLRGKVKAIVAILVAMIAISLGGTLWTAAVIIKYNTYASRDKVELPVTFWLVTSGVADVAIALTLVWQLLLVKKKTVRISTESRMISVLNKLVRKAIETGSVTATVAIITFCCYITNVEANISTGIAFSLGRIYTLTMIFTLLGRLKPDNTEGSSTSGGGGGGRFGAKSRFQNTFTVDGIRVDTMQTTVIQHEEMPMELMSGRDTTFRGAVEADEEHSVYKVKTDSLREKEGYP